MANVSHIVMHMPDVLMVEQAIVVGIQEYLNLHCLLFTIAIKFMLIEINMNGVFLVILVVKHQMVLLYLNLKTGF